MKIFVANWRDRRHPKAGGSEVSIEQITRCWAADGHDVTIFTSALDGLRADEIDECGRRIVRKGGTLGVYGAARKWFRANPDFDVALESVNTRPFLVGAWCDTARPVALHHQLCADVWPYEVPLPIALVGRYILEPWWLRRQRSTPTIAVSQSTANDLKARGFASVRVIHNGLETKVASTSHVETPPYVAIIGRLSANKRPDHALAAAEEARKTFPQLGVVVVGAGPMLRELQAAYPDVSFLGRVENDERDRVMSGASAVLVASVREGWGMVVTEAAALGTLSVGYDVPGLRDSIAAAGGVLCDPNPESMAAALVRLLRDDLAYTFTPTASGLHGWATMAAEVLEFAMATKTGPPALGTDTS